MKLLSPLVLVEAPIDRDTQQHVSDCVQVKASFSGLLRFFRKIAREGLFYFHTIRYLFYHLFNKDFFQFNKELSSSFPPKKNQGKTSESKYKIIP